MAAVARMRLKAAEVVLAGGGRSKSDRGWRDGGPRARGGHRRAMRGPGASSALAELRAHVIPGTLRASRVPRRTSGPPRAPLGSSGALGFTWRPWPPRASAGFGGRPSVALASPGRPGLARVSPCSSGPGRGRRSAPRSPVPYLSPQCLTSALPVPYPVPYLANPMILLAGRPRYTKVLLLRLGRRIDLEHRMRPACKFIGFAR